MLAWLGTFWRSMWGPATFGGSSDITAQSAEERTLEGRRRKFLERELIYDNKIYRRLQYGGMAERIFEVDLGVPAGEYDQTKVYGYFNPFQEIVDVYQHCIPGDWGQLLKVAPKITAGQRDVNPAILSADPIGRMWRWSNLAVAKDPLQYMAANLGTVGIRIVAQAGNVESRRVYLAFDHPGWIVDFDEDARGNVTDIILKSSIFQGALGDEDKEEITVVERMSKTSFSREYNGKEQLSAEERRNDLGVCPYVILRHRARNGFHFGLHAYNGSEGIVHLINQLISRGGKSVYDHAYPHWFASAAGGAPSEIEVGGGKMTYVQLNEGAPDPHLEPLVAKLNHESLRQYFLTLIEELRKRQPEMNLNDVELLSHTSADLLAQVLKPVEAVVGKARTRYLDALSRAFKIGMSEMIRLDMLDLGSGGGSRDAADRAFGEGMEDFDFADMPVLPETIFDKGKRIDVETQQRKRDIEDANAAGSFVDQTEQLRIAGYTGQQIAAIMERSNRQIPSETL